MAAAKFCIECGRPLGGAAPSAGSGGGGGRRAMMESANQTLRNLPLTWAFAGVFVFITIVGLGLAAWIHYTTPEAVRARVAGGEGEGAGASNIAPATNAMTGTAGGNAPGQLPTGHPKIELPTEARSYIDKLEKDAKSKPQDIEAWNKLGTVSMRAAMFDDIYYAKAEDAYAHALKLDPDNLEALRGIGDIDYDHNKYDEAVAAYEHYLKKKPDDPEVRTDLGTMYLYTGNADQALVQYKKALQSKPDFFQAYYNMGVAYAEGNKQAEAREALGKALTLAPDDNARTQVKQLIAKVSGTGGGAETASAATGAAPPAGGAPAAASSASAPAAAPATFHGEVEQVMRNLPFAGPKVGSLQWAGDLKGKVLMNSFPMDQMPPFAKAKFLGDIKSGIETAKKDHKVTGKVTLDIVDGASGKVMDSITE
jgi:tetratricopeptide (TPR) repeat protein